MNNQALLSFTEKRGLTISDILNLSGFNITDKWALTTTSADNSHIRKYLFETKQDCMLINCEMNSLNSLSKIVDGISLIVIDSTELINTNLLKKICELGISKEYKTRLIIINDDDKLNTYHVHDMMKSFRWLQLKVGFSEMDSILDRLDISVLDLNSIDKNQATLLDLDNTYIRHLGELKEIV